MDKQIKELLNEVEKVKKEKCPECGSINLGDQWQVDRKLQQYCKDYDCGWEGPKRSPETRVIKVRKKVNVNSGFCFEIYDKYGYILMFSRSYGSRSDSITEIKKELKKNDPSTQPRTAILWPSYVEVEGEVFKKGEK